jgi:3-dehydroquinate synthase
MPSTILFDPIGVALAALPRWTQMAVLVDENTKAHCYPLVQHHLPDHVLIEIPSGEEHKHLGTCEHIWDALTRHHFDRKSVVLNLGGGVIGDMGGFCAATYKRGMDFVQVPTTLLAQVDASVGGKLGIDFQGFKNHLGVFQEPLFVLIDVNFLGTLSQRELRSGFAEVVKHGLIADRAAWDALRSRSLGQLDWGQVVPHSVRLKEKVVAQDPTEKGLRKILNFGHTVGHAVESWFLTHQPLGGRLLHGEAIAVGMVAEAWLSVQKGLLPASELAMIEAYLLQTYGRVALPEAALPEMAHLARQDKKNEGQVILACLLRAAGEAVYDIPLTEAEIVESLRYYAGGLT